MNVKISHKQSMFLQASTRGKFFLGGIGSGKSRIIGYAAICDALRGERSCIVSFSYRSLRDVNLEILRDCMTAMGLKEKTDYELAVSDMIATVRGTEILLRSADAPDRLRGLNLSSFYLDEMREFSDRSIYDIMQGRLRQANAHWGGVSSTNGYNWFWEIIKSEGLDYVWSLPDRVAANERLTVIVQSTHESPFLPEDYVQTLEHEYGSLYAQQELNADIVELSAGFINPKWFIIVDKFRAKAGCRYWDIAVTVKDKSDESAGALGHWSGDRFCINDLIHVKLKYPDLRELIINQAIVDGPEIIVGLEDAGQQRAIIDDLRREMRLRRHTIKALKPRGDKLARALPWISQAELGNVTLCRGGWNKAFIDQARAFGPHAVKDDMIDAVSGCYHTLITAARVTGGRLPIGA